jgi:protein-disulfide isomerase
MTKSSILRTGLACFALAGAALAQSSSATPPQTAQPGAAPAPLQLNGIAPPQKIQFPAPDPKDFTAQSPTSQEVNAFLKQLWGYDPNRVWQVAGIQRTDAPQVSRVTVFVAEQGVSHTPATTVFFVTPDGKHAIAGNDVIAFGAHPFASTQATLEQRATGPYRGAANSKLLLVEFADLQCPHCKEASTAMTQLASDFPNAKIVFQNFPLTNVHPAAEKAAEYGVCVAKEKGNAAFFKYVQAVYDAQAGLTGNADQTLNQAVTTAGADPTAVATCAATPAAKAAVASSVKLGQDIGVNQTPLLFVNGRSIPVAGIPYNTLKQIVSYAAEQNVTPATQASASSPK